MSLWKLRRNPGRGRIRKQRNNIMKDTHGKSVVAGCQTPTDEDKHLRKDAKRLKKEHDKWEKSKKFKKVPILHGYLLVPIEKWKANKKYYNSLNQ